jgi:hypothetical protein
VARRVAWQRLLSDCGIQRDLAETGLGLAPFTSEVVAKGNWVAVYGDLLPHIRAGLDECWKRGFLPDSKDLADYRIGGIFLG